MTRPSTPSASPPAGTRRTPTPGPGNGVRLVLFDIDGTLIHTNRAGVTAFERTFASEFGIPGGTAGIRFAGRTDTGIVRDMFVKHGIEARPENFRRFFEAYLFWLDHILAGSTRGGLFPGVLDFIRDSAALDRPPVVGLLTGNIRLGAEIKLRHFQVWDLFTLGAFGDEDEDRNRLAAIARERGSRHAGRSLAGEEILVIGDTPHDIACGRAIGARVLAVSTGGATAADLRSHQPDWLVTSLREITAAEVCG